MCVCVCCSTSSEPMGTFVLWLQFPGMSNLCQLLRTCHLSQRSLSLPPHQLRLRPHLGTRPHVCGVGVCLNCLSSAHLSAWLPIHTPSVHVCVSVCVYVVECVVCACLPTWMCLCVSICVCWTSLSCIWSSIDKDFPTRLTAAGLPNSPDVSSVRRRLNERRHTLVIQDE